MNVNSQIANRILFTGFCERTYYTQELYDFWVDNYADPDVLFKVKIWGKYKMKYKWSDAQTDQWIKENLEESKGFDVNGIWHAYDWGSGRHKIKPMNKMHEPNLDHIIPSEQGGDNNPGNLRIRCRRLNENKGNTNSDIERIATICDMIDDIEDTDSLQAVQEYINKMKDKI